MFHTPWSSPRPLTSPTYAIRYLYIFHTTGHITALTTAANLSSARLVSPIDHRRHGTALSHAAASHQPRATEPFGGVLARTELQFLRAEFSRLRVVCASMSQAVACESSISIPFCGAIAVLLQAMHCHRRTDECGRPVEY